MLNNKQKNQSDSFQSSVSSDNEPTNIYYNVSIRNTDNNNVNGYPLASFKETRTASIVDKCSDYYLSILRFSVPTTDIPIMVCPIQTSPNKDVNKTIYSLTLEWEGQIIQEYVIYAPRTSGMTPPQQELGAGEYQIVNDYYYVYDYQHLLDLINITFKTAFNKIVGVSNDVKAPYITFDSVTNLFTLSAQKEYYDLAAVSPVISPIKVYLNKNLFYLFANMYSSPSVNALYGKDYLMRIQDPLELVDLGSKINLVQEYSSLSNWNSFCNLVFLTDSVPIATEIVQSSVSFGSTQDTGGRAVSRPILTDFNPAFESGASGKEAFNLLQYSIAGEYRLIDMLSDSPLYRFTVSIHWQDQYGNLYPLRLFPNTQANIKFVFRKKKFYKSL